MGEWLRVSCINIIPCINIIGYVSWEQTSITVNRQINENLMEMLMPYFKIGLGNYDYF